ncbi:MAG: FAD-binding oxidoreductase [Anaerolineaceae bacterium]|nr:FAD-binding oxidoreductase [Anaerolineaceae bacterium]
MTLPKNVYKALEDIVGAANISDDPALLDSYRYSLAHTAIHLGPYYDTHTPRGAAVLLPGNTEEVQAIVKLCNRYKIKFKASSTFWSAQGYPSEDDTIQLDMRRMDRILEIDEKNMHAVVEPGVIAATLQAEAMKVGLNTHIPGSGCSCSPLASATSYFGSGPGNLYGGWYYDNLLGMEWVMPTGEILRTGSLGSGCGWFCGEGPGPSMKGVARGFLGAKGAMGVFTKCAIKLFAWPGPATLPVEGTIPAYKVSLPDRLRAYTLAFPSWKAWADAAHLIWDTGIGYLAHRQFSMFGRDLKYAMVKILTEPTRTLGDLEELLEDPEVQRVTEESMRDFQIVLAGMTARDLEWQEKALDEILARTGGWKVEAMNDPDVADWTLLYMIRLGHKNLNLVFGGSYDGCFGLLGAADFGTAHVEEAAAFKKDWEKRGAVVEAGGDCMMGPIGGQGGGGTCLWENFTCFDPSDRESVEGTRALFDAATCFGLEKGWGVGMEKWNAQCRGADGRTTPKEERDRMHLSAPQPSVFRYQHKVREALNPNELGDEYFETLDVDP